MQAQVWCKQILFLDSRQHWSQTLHTDHIAKPLTLEGYKYVNSWCFAYEIIVSTSSKIPDKSVLPVVQHWKKIIRKTHVFYLLIWMNAHA